MKNKMEEIKNLSRQKYTALDWRRRTGITTRGTAGNGTVIPSGQWSGDEQLACLVHAPVNLKAMG
jgi:hypothetical protein